MASAALLTAPASALAAPTCQTATGETAKCGTPWSMPVGWSLPADQRAQIEADAPPGPSDEQLLSLAVFLGGLFLLIALMPAFDGWTRGDWDRQEGDDGGAD